MSYKKERLRTALLSLWTSLEITDLPKASRKLHFSDVQEPNVGQDGAVSITTRYWLDGPAIESQWERGFTSRGPPSLLHNRHRVIPGGKVAGASRGPPTPHLAPRLKSRAIPLLHLWAFVACSRVTFTFLPLQELKNATEG